MLLDLEAFVFLVIAGWLFITQIILPVIFDRPLFPMFHKDRREELVHSLQDLNDDAEEAVLEAELKEKQAALAAYKEKRKDESSQSQHDQHQSVV